MAVSAAKVRAVFLSLDGVIEGGSIFGQTDADRAFFVDAKQIGHFVEGGVEVRLTSRDRATARHAQSG